MEAGAGEENRPLKRRELGKDRSIDRLPSGTGGGERIKA